MKKISEFPSVLVLTIYALGLMTCLVNAQSPLITIETVPVGNINNAADNVIMPDGTSAYGSVDYKYRIGKYEIAASQYCIFLNAVAKSDPFGLYLEQMAADPNVRSITRTGSSGAYKYSVISGCENKPISYVTWFSAARFCNWLHNGAAAGASTEIGAYMLNGATSGVEFTHQSNARFRLPTENEWYKAAFYDPNKNSGTGGYWKYSNRSDSMSTTQANYFYAYSDANGNRLTDVGYFSSSVSAYGTYDQGGNLWEWTEAVVNGTLRGMRGGGFTELDGGGPTFYNTGHFGGNPGNVAPGENGFNGWGNGFRVVAIGDFDNDGIPDAYETNTGTYGSATDTGTDPNNADSDGDGLADGVETNTGTYVSASNTGTNPNNSDTSGDGITDGEAVTAQFNPLIDQRPVLNFLTQAVTAQPNRFGFYNESNVMHLGMGGLMIRKSGSVVNLDLQWQTKTSLTNAWTKQGSPIPFFLNLPGNKAFIRLQASPGAQ